MSLINSIIPKQGFEIVRDVIGAILKTELDNQKVLQNFSYPINIFNSRSTTFSHAEKVMINVLLDSANYSNFHEKGAHSGTNYFIDVYVSSKQTEDSEGDFNAASVRDKFLGMIRFILQDHHYKILGLPKGTIMGTYVENFENFEPKNTQDAAFVKMGRLLFNVRINETQTLWDGININTIFTGVKLDLTDNGYQYITEN